LTQLAKVDLLILDDFGMNAIPQEARTDLLDVIEARLESRARLMTSQVPVEKYDSLREGTPTVADALLDRLVSGAIRITLRGESMRRLGAKGIAARWKRRITPRQRKRSESRQNHWLVSS
jgi:DNA replication protein DnaC